MSYGDFYCSKCKFAHSGECRGAPCFRCDASSVGFFSVTLNGTVATAAGVADGATLAKKPTCPNCMTYLEMLIASLGDCARASFRASSEVTAEKWNECILRDARALLGAP